MEIEEKVEGNENTVETIPVEIESETEAKIKGHWKYVKHQKVNDPSFLKKFPIERAFAVEDALPYPPDLFPNLIFDKGTVFSVSYPTHVISRYKYSLEGASIVHHYNNHKDSYPYQVEGDTLFIYHPFNRREYLKVSYVPTVFDDSIVSILKKHNANYPELAGTWRLVRESSGNDGSEYVLDFPYTIPDSITISREEFMAGVKNNNVYWMNTSGVKRDYSFSYKWGKLHLQPGTWYQGDDPFIHFEPMEE